MSIAKRAIAELIGTFWLVFGGCGSALLACGAGEHGIHYVGVALAFGLTVLTMAYAIGHISGCHLNPAVTLGLVAAGRFKGKDTGETAKDALCYIIAQCIGGLIAAAILYFIWTSVGNAPTGIAGSFATNGWATGAEARFGGAAFGMGPVLIVECLLTCVFLFVIIGATDKRAPAGFGPIAIGLCLTLIHLISIPVSNTSVNPARSIAMAVFAGGETIMMALVISAVTIVGGVIAGLLYKFVFECKCCDCKDCKCEKKEEVKEEKKDDEKEVAE